MTDQSAHCGTTTEVEARGRDETTENFPVGSWLLPRKTRADVLAFYRFARAADDIADCVTLTLGQKITTIERIGAIFDGAAPVSAEEHAAADLMASLARTGVSDLHARQILQAFRRDAENPRCRNWSDLMLYCRYSAVPVGRFLIDLHGEGQDAYPAADALCTALQVLNHLQDCGRDLADMDRVYLPIDWIEAEQTSIDQLCDGSLTAGMRRVLDRCLDRVDQLLAQARPLPAQLGRSRLRYEAAVIVEIASRLAQRLRREDPLARRVALTKGQRFACLVRGVVQVWRLR